MAVIHITEADAARDFTGLMVQIRAGTEIVIDNGSDPIAVLCKMLPPRQSVSACIALAKKHEEDSGHAPVLDPDFAVDVEDIVALRKPWNPPAWD